MSFYTYAECMLGIKDLKSWLQPSKYKLNLLKNKIINAKNNRIKFNKYEIFISYQIFIIRQFRTWIEDTPSIVKPIVLHPLSVHLLCCLILHIRKTHSEFPAPL